MKKCKHDSKRILNNICYTVFTTMSAIASLFAHSEIANRFSCWAILISITFRYVMRVFFTNYSDGCNMEWNKRINIYKFKGCINFGILAMKFREMFK